MENGAGDSYINRGTQEGGVHGGNESADSFVPMGDTTEGPALSTGGEGSASADSFAPMEPAVASERRPIDSPELSIEAASDRQDAAIARTAHDTVERAKAEEPETTDTLSRIATESGGHLEGLQYRLKSEESLGRKIGDKVAQAQDLTPEEAAEHTNEVSYQKPGGQVY